MAEFRKQIDVTRTSQRPFRLATILGTAGSVVLVLGALVTVLQYFGVTPTPLRFGLESIGLPVRAGLRHRVFGPGHVRVGQGVMVQDGISVSVVQTYATRQEDGDFARLGVSAYAQLELVPLGNNSGVTIVSQEQNGAILVVPAGGSFSFRVSGREYTVSLLGVQHMFYVHLAVSVNG